MIIIDQESLKAAKRQGTYTYTVPMVIDKKEYPVDVRLINGEMETYQLTKPIGELMTSASLEDKKDLLRKVTLDVQLGREQVPTLYEPIYQPISDPNFPKVLQATWAMYGNVVFLEHLEGQEVHFGNLSVEQGPIATIQEYAAGFEYTKELIDFNEMFRIELINQAIGQAYNALLNHIHLGAIINYSSYNTANTTDWQGGVVSDNNPLWLGIYKTLRKAIVDATKAKRVPTVLLANPSDRFDIEMALRGGFTLNGTTYPPLSGINSIIYYEGWEGTLNGKPFTYPGVRVGTAYLIRPKQGFKELIKRDLTIETTSGDLSRLVEAQIVAYAYRGVFAAIDENVQKVKISAS